MKCTFVYLHGFNVPFLLQVVEHDVDLSQSVDLLLYLILYLLLPLYLSADVTPFEDESGITSSNQLSFRFFAVCQQNRLGHFYKENSVVKQPAGTGPSRRHI